MADATFLILSYNQAEFLDETLDSAFAQDFHSLEILVSDDASKDDSVEVAERAAANYRGPHQVRIRRNRRNLGLTAHLFEAARAATSDFIVVSASDDRSRSDRVSRLRLAQQETGADALFSDYRLIDGAGNLLETEAKVRGDVEDGLRLSRYFPGRQINHILGMSSAYRKSVFDTVPEPTVPIQSEDLYFTLFLTCAGNTIAHVRETLVDYRTHGTSLSNRFNAGLSIVDQEVGAMQVATLQSAVLRAFADGMEKGCELSPDWEIIGEDEEFLRLKGRWHSLSSAERLRAYAHFNYQPWRRWMAPRLFGMTPYSMLKRAVNFVRG